MSYEILIPKSKKYVLCRIKKPITTDLSRKFTLEAESLGIKHNILNFLYDARGVSNIEKVHKTYQYAYEEMKELKFTRSARVAILVSPDDKSHDFAAVVIKNAGYNVKLFKEEKTAIKWLEGEKPGKNIRKNAPIELKSL